VLTAGLLSLCNAAEDRRQEGSVVTLDQHFQVFYERLSGESSLISWWNETGFSERDRMAFGVIGIRRHFSREPRERFDASFARLLGVDDKAKGEDLLDKIRLLTDALESGVATDVHLSHPLLVAISSLWSSKTDAETTWREYEKQVEQLSPSYRALVIARVPRPFLQRAIELGERYASLFDGEASGSLRETLDGLRNAK
jgi:hypothetical protein